MMLRTASNIASSSWPELDGAPATSRTLTPSSLMSLSQEGDRVPAGFLLHRADGRVQCDRDLIRPGAFEELVRAR